MPLLNSRFNPSRLVIAGALAAALGACAHVGPNFVRPQPPATHGYAMNGDKAAPHVTVGPGADGAWWTAFQSPDLDRTIRQALADNPSIAEADATLEAMRQETLAEKGGLGPQGDLSAGISHERINVSSFGFSGFPNPTITLYSVGPTVSYDLDLFGGEKRGLENAWAQTEAQAQRADAAYLSISGNVALEAVAVAQARGEIEALQAMIADDRQNLDLARKAVTLGGAPQSAGVSAQAQLSQDEALLPPLEQELAVHRHALAVLLGKAPADFSPPDFDLESLKLPTDIPVELPSELVRRRPDILAAESDLHAATAQIGVETAKLYPDVKLTAAFVQSALTPGNLFSYAASGWSLGSGLTVPILNRGALRANKRAAEAAARASMARYQATVVRAFGEVADTLQALANDENEIKAQNHALRDAEANLSDQRLAFDKGAGTVLQVLDAQRQLHSARRGLVRAEGQRLADAVRLFVATGADWRVPRPS
jgi:NodT family efflux transporter outer membrane factor (OMF) lipoprotein